MKWKIYIIYIILMHIMFPQLLSEYWQIMFPHLLSEYYHIMFSHLCIHMSQYPNVGEWMIYLIIIDISYLCITLFHISIELFLYISHNI